LLLIFSVKKQNTHQKWSSWKGAGWHCWSSNHITGQCRRDNKSRGKNLQQLMNV